jgi:hypothetical protein
MKVKSIAFFLLASFHMALCAPVADGSDGAKAIASGPLTDRHQMTIEVAQVTPDTQNTDSIDADAFAITVSRVDDLVNDKNQIIAERIAQVELKFDIVDGILHCNGVHIPFGVSNQQVSTCILVFGHCKSL